jgi:hypothetical protein
VPTLGFLIVGYVLVNAELNAKIAGACWMTVGVIALLLVKRLGKRPGALLDEEL